MKIKVKFTATFEAVIDVSDKKDVDSAISNIDIPENEQCSYVEDSFEPVTTDDGDVLLLDMDDEKLPERWDGMS